MSDNKKVLVVVSKLKSHIKETTGLNTSGNVAEKLSSMIEVLCNKAAENAKSDGRKTIMDRDFESVTL